MTSLDDIRAHVFAMKGVTESYPFGPEPAVFKVAGKMFLSARFTKSPLNINLKCDPDRALMLREIFDAVLPGYHMNKRHWNTVVLDQSIPGDQIREFIDHSYALVIAALPRSRRRSLIAAGGEITKNRLPDG